MKQEWNISLTCGRCKTTKYKYIRAEYKKKKAIGCKECGLNTELEMKQQYTTVGDLKVSIDYPYWYC